MPSWIPLASFGHRQVENPRRRRGVEPRGALQDQGERPQERSPLLPFGHRAGSPPQPRTYAEAAGSRSPPPPTQGAASEALHRGWPGLPRSTRQPGWQGGPRAEAPRGPPPVTASRNPFAPTPPEVVIRADLLPGQQDILPRRQPPHARRPLPGPRPVSPPERGGKGEASPHLRPARFGAFASQRRAGEAAAAPDEGRQEERAGGEDGGEGGKNAGHARPGMVDPPRVRRPARERRSAAWKKPSGACWSWRRHSRNAPITASPTSSPVNGEDGTARGAGNARGGETGRPSSAKQNNGRRTSRRRRPRGQGDPRPRSVQARSRA